MRQPPGWLRGIFSLAAATSALMCLSAMAHAATAPANTIDPVDTLRRRADELAVQGRDQLKQAATAGLAADENKRLTDAARSSFQEAEAVFASLEQRLSDTYRAFPKFIRPDQKELAEELERVRRDLVEAQLDLAGVIYEIAQLYAPESQDRRARLAEAAGRYALLYRKYNSKLAGFCARVGQGRCFLEMGDPERAFAACEEVLLQPDEPVALRVLKTKALALALEAALRPGMKKHKQALAMYGAWNSASDGSKASPAETAEIQYRAGTVALEYARGLDASDPAQAKLRDEALRTAREALAFAARGPGEYKQKARVRLADPLLGRDGSDVAKAGDFAGARDRAKAAMNRMEALEAEARALPSGRPEDLKRIRQEIGARREEALRWFQRAMELQTATTPLEEVIAARYYQAYLHLAAGRAKEAAEIGESLARNYADGPAGRQGAKIALAALSRLVNDARSASERKLQADRLLDFAQYIVKQWPATPETDAARLMLVETAVAEDKLDMALQFLGQVPPQSNQRGRAELAVGRALWLAYIQRARLPGDRRPPSADLDRLAAQAQQVLAEGIDRLQKFSNGDASAVLAPGALLLAQVEIELDRPLRAIALLEDKRIGAKAMLVSKNPIATADFRSETYRTTLRALVAVGQWKKKAVITMAELDAWLEKTAGVDSDRQLLQFYLALGRDIQGQVERLWVRQKNELLGRTVGAWEGFATGLLQDDEGRSFHGRLCAAEVLAAVGAGIEAGGPVLQSGENRFYRRAADAYGEILKQNGGKGNPVQADDVLDGIKIRQARCLRALGQYAEALSLLREVLKRRETTLDAQTEAAYTYQVWAGTNKDLYRLAIEGSQKYPEIWGWRRLVQQLTASGQHEAILIEAEYNLALCGTEVASALPAGEQRAALQEIEADLRRFLKARPDMVGSPWYDRYNGLLRRVGEPRKSSPTTGGPTNQGETS
jgi:cellulose synthase operon protein C